MRRIAVFGSLLVGSFAATTPVLAHGVGGRADLPVPTSYFIVGAGVVLIISFVALAVLWPEPRMQEPVEQRRVAGRWVSIAARIGAAIGVLGLAGVVLTGVLDGGDATLHPAPLLVWIGFWLVIPFISALVGNIWHAINPWRTLGRWFDIGNEERPERTHSLGIWPATVALFAFTWLELVSPDSGAPSTLAVAALIYTAYLLGAMAWAGRETGIAAFDAFTPYNRFIASISPVRIDDEGIAIGKWLRQLPQLEPLPGMAAFVVVAIATVTYDGLSGTETWEDWFGSTSREMWFGTVAMLAFVAVIGLAYWIAAFGAQRLGQSSKSPGEIAADFAHTLVHIALAYAFAHYFTLILLEGQQIVAALSDPFARGWDLFGTAGWRVNFFLSPEVVWYVQVAAIVAGHVAGVVLAHDRALADFKPDYAVRTQYAMLALMVALTSLGLLVLAG